MLNQYHLRKILTV